MRGRLWLTAALWLGLMWVVSALHDIAPPPGLRLPDGDWQLEARAPRAAPARPAPLPDTWTRTQPQLLVARYHSAFVLDRPPAEPWAVYLPSLSTNAEVRINGVSIGDGGPLTEPMARHRYRPLLFRIPSERLAAGRNRIAIDLHAAPAGTGFLQGAYVGAEARLKPYLHLRHFLKVEFMIGLIVALTVLASVSAGVWLLRRHERVYLWHAVSSVAYALYALTFAAAELPLSSLWWDWARYIGIAWAIGAVTVFGIHFLGLSRPRVVRAVGWACALGPLVLAALAAADADLFYRVAARGWDSAVLAFGVYPVALFVRELWRRNDARAFWMFAAATSLLLGGLHDVLLVNHLIPPFNGHYMHYTVPLPVTVFTWILLERFAVAMRESETLTRELAMRVAQKSQELERAFEDKRALERQHAVAQERERILRDMHDGLGGRLVSTLARLETSGQGATPVAETVRESLADLRLIIYSLEPSAQDLRAALGLMRDRLGPACAAAGLAVRWQFADLPDPCELGPRDTLAVMRVVQEATTNVLKHARARRLDLCAGAAAYDGRAGIEVTVSDDGLGLRAPVVNGKGLDNMRHRAARLGGYLAIESLQPGTRVRLWLPLDLTAERPPAALA